MSPSPVRSHDMLRSGNADFIFSMEEFPKDFMLLIYPFARPVRLSNCRLLIDIDSIY